MSAPESVNLTAAARQVLRSQDHGGQSALTARYVWEDLTGLDGDEALAYARQVAAARSLITAHVPPM